MSRGSHTLFLHNCIWDFTSFIDCEQVPKEALLEPETHLSACCWRYNSLTNAKFPPMASSTQHIVLAKYSAVSAVTRGLHFFNKITRLFYYSNINILRLWVKIQWFSRPQTCILSGYFLHSLQQVCCAVTAVDASRTAHWRAHTQYATQTRKCQQKNPCRGDNYTLLPTLGKAFPRSTHSV